MEILVITVLLLLNGVFAMYEIALVSARKSRLEEKSKSGSRGAKVALSLLKEPEKILSAIQVGITLIGIVSGAYGGLAIAEDIEPWFKSITFLSSYAHSLSIILVVSFITYFSLIIGELVPKTLALNNAENIAVLLSPFMRIMGKITHPIIRPKQQAHQIRLPQVLENKEAIAGENKPVLKIHFSPSVLFIIVNHELRFIT